jgi:hypothetical protein
LMSLAFFAGRKLIVKQKSIDFSASDVSPGGSSSPLLDAKNVGEAR